MSAFMIDLRYGFRLLLRSPGFTFIAVSALAVGIGANVTIFGFVNALVLTPLDAVEPHRLIRADSGGADRMPVVTYRDYLQYRDRNQSLSSLTMFYPGWMAAVRIDGPAEMIAVTPMSGNYFDTLGVTAALGRTITPADDEPGAPRVVVLSDVGWRRHFGTDETVLGRTITIDRKAFTVVGVTPGTFKGTVSPNIPQLYAPFQARGVTDETSGFLIGRLKPGVGLGEAQADLSRIAAQLTAEQGQRKSIAVYPGTTSFPSLVKALASLGALFMVAVIVVLWIACNNIALLLLARSATRRREIGIRLAIGASRLQLLRHLLIESLLLASAGGLGAVAFAFVTSRWLTQIYLPVPMPIALTFDFDWRVVTFAIGISLLATLLFGLGPAIQSLSLRRH